MAAPTCPAVLGACVAVMLCAPKRAAGAAGHGTAAATPLGGERGVRNLCPPQCPFLLSASARPAEAFVPRVPLGPPMSPTGPSLPCALSLLPVTNRCCLSSPVCQYEQAADAELAWVAETKRKLMALGPIRLEQDQTTAQLQVQKVRAHSLLRGGDGVGSEVGCGLGDGLGFGGAALPWGW